MAEQDVSEAAPRAVDREAAHRAPSARRRVLLVASAGGHWVQLSRLSPAFEGYEASYATTLDGVAAPSGSKPVTVIRDASRSNPAMFAIVFLQLLWLILRTRPHVVVSTGAAPGLLALPIAKAFGARTVWIDSLANCERLSLSGRIARHFADLWLTQWPHLADPQAGLRCYGSVL